MYIYTFIRLHWNSICHYSVCLFVCFFCLSVCPDWDVDLLIRCEGNSGIVCRGSIKLWQPPPPLALPLHPLPLLLPSPSTPSPTHPLLDWLIGPCQSKFDRPPLYLTSHWTRPIANEKTGLCRAKSWLAES